ncbi:CpsD/CapB family tyrosine-protein kinase [Clostridium cellulovorans]|uniref:non-specific protein-tyrosine kinase n=1 Tax=Clostridium cellulovorans (strain ATCC 35296 / DSM 3052 / OCM 3 / 743B) TaxID=573061 RepID=D9SR41_CLOC7|nr:CpsD/CapB family tyrosine-protein kinase [Clostridium cellulovorans]ADL50329.1 capsular exopolysaccharide family [Clostridium cellulovorans 743B]
MLKSLVTHLDPKSVISETYRTLRTNIQYANIDGDLRSIIITSSSPSEGKSTTVANLAIATAQTGKKILIIDADLRKPSVHKKFGISNQLGLTNVLTEQCEIFSAIQKSEVRNLYILASGPIPPNPSELLGSKKMQNLLDLLKSKFDMVIIDTPPVLAVTDSQILSTEVDGVILVAVYGKTDKKALIKAKERLDKVDANLLGSILTRVPANSKNGSSYYYYYYGEKKAK